MPKSNDKDNKPAGKLSKSKSSSSFLDRVRQGKIAKSDNPDNKRPNRETLAKAVAQSNSPKLLFTMDATISRQTCWSMARELTVGMFQAVPEGLEIALGYHSGGRVQEITPFSSNYQLFSQQILSVECAAGLTDLNGILSSSLNFNRLKVIIYIGDCYEENLSQGISLAQKLKLQGTKIFLFHDNGSVGYNTAEGKEAFEKIAQANGGAVFSFDSSSPAVVAELLAAIAYYAAKGLEALKQLKSSGATKLLQAMNGKV